MDAVDFVRTLYLGDRACKSITIDAWNAAVRITVNTISRVRSPSGQWDYYTAEDVDDGVLVFDGVTYIDLRNDGALPNDLINAIEAELIGSQTEIRLSIDSVAADAAHRETILTVRCRAVYIEDASRPGHKIVD